MHKIHFKIYTTEAEFIVTKTKNIPHKKKDKNSVITTCIYLKNKKLYAKCFAKNATLKGNVHRRFKVKFTPELPVLQVWIRFRLVKF